MQKGGGGGEVQIACKNEYVINGRPLMINEKRFLALNGNFTIKRKSKFSRGLRSLLKMNYQVSTGGGGGYICP